MGAIFTQRQRNIPQPTESRSDSILEVEQTDSRPSISKRIAGRFISPAFLASPHEVKDGSGGESMTEPRNRVVQVSRFGDPDGLEVVDAAVPTAGRGEVRVHVLASSLQYTDVLIRRHLYPQTTRRRPPFVMGYDVVGEIDQVGDGVHGFKVGDRVADMTVIGSNATYRTLRADDLTRVLEQPQWVSSLGTTRLDPGSPTPPAHHLPENVIPDSLSRFRPSAETEEEVHRAVDE